MIRWGWLSGFLPLTHTWVLPNRALEAGWMPLYLLLVLLSGVSIWSLLDRGRTAQVGAVVAAGWLLSLGFGLVLRRWPTGGPAEAAGLAAATVAWIVLLGWSGVAARRAGGVRRFEGQPS